MNYLTLYKRTLKDLFTFEVFLTFMFPFLIIVTFFAVELFVYSNYILPYFESLITFTENEILLWILNAFITIFFLAILLLVNVFVGINLIGLFFLENIINTINKKYYKKDLTESLSILEVFKLSTAIFLKYFKYLLFMLPLTFIPVVGAFLPLIPAFFMFYKTLLVETGANITEKSVVQQSDKYYIAFIFPMFILTLVPIFGTFGYILGFIGTTHYLLNRD